MTIAKDKLTEVERKCREAIAAREAEGIVVVPLCARPESDNEFCLLDAVDGRKPASTACVRLGVSEDEVLALEAGFEDWPSKEELAPALYSLGQTLRAEQMAKGGV